MFKVGDRVRRIDGGYAGMKIGDFGTVIKVGYDGRVRIQEFNDLRYHSAENLVKVNTFKGNK